MRTRTLRNCRNYAFMLTRGVFLFYLLGGVPVPAADKIFAKSGIEPLDFFTPWSLKRVVDILREFSVKVIHGFFSLEFYPELLVWET